MTQQEVDETEHKSHTLEVVREFTSPGPKTTLNLTKVTNAHSCGSMTAMLNTQQEILMFVTKCMHPDSASLRNNNKKLLGGGHRYSVGGHRY